MKFDNVYYFHVHFGCDFEGWKERDEYGFITAQSFIEAMTKIADVYRDDLMSVNLECIGDTSIICINNKELAEKFKEAFISTHYWEDEE